MHPNSGRRRRHSDELKARVLADCDEPGASISGVALAHGLNANLVRKWRTDRGAKLGGSGRPISSAQRHVSLLGATHEFVAIKMPAASKAAATTTPHSMIATSSGGALIHIELRRGPLHLNVRWPAAAADDCRAWLSELSSGLLK